MLLLLLLLSVGIAFVVHSVSALVAVSGMPTLILPRRIQIQILYVTLNTKPDTASQCRSAFVPSYGPQHLVSTKVSLTVYNPYCRAAIGVGGQHGLWLVETW